MNLLRTHAKNGPRPDYRRALLDSLVKLNPLYLGKDSPVMLVVEAGFALVLAMGLATGAFAGLVNQARWFYFVIAGILLLTVWFSTLSEAVSEAQGRARVDALRTLEKDVPARKIVGHSEVIVPSRHLDPGDVVRVNAGEFIPRDGVIKEGNDYIDEPMMTGESIPSYKESGGHVIGGTKVATDSILVTIVAEAGKSYLDQMISLVENAKRPKSASEVSLTILLVGLTAIFLVVCSAFLFLADHLGLLIDLAILISLLVALMPKSIDFSAENRVSGVELFVPRPGTLGIQELPTAPPEAAESRIWRLLLDLEVSARPAKVLKGAVDAILDLSPEVNEAELLWQAQEISKTGGTPIAVAVDRLVVGLINLRDNLKPHIREKLDAVRATGIKTVMVTGDAELTARVIAQEAGIDEVMAGAKPADKLVRVELEQKRGHVVGVEGDGTNDAPALAKADVGIAMNSGTSAAREAANMVDLDSDPAKILKVVEVGKQLLMTRGAITTFSVTNDIAKYFTLFPAVIPGNPAARLLDVMQLHSPVTAVLATMLFNAAIIPALIPLALKGVKFRAAPMERTFVRNMAIYGLGGAAL